MNIVTRSVSIDGTNISYTLEYKPVKNLNLRVRKNGSIYVSANESVSPQKVDEFVLRRASYIFYALKQFEEFLGLKSRPKEFVSGETFYIQGRGLRLKVIEGSKESIGSDGIYIFLNLKDASDFSKKQQMVTRFLYQQCRDVFEEVIAQTYPPFQKYGVAHPTLRIREMDTRWGSCSPKIGVITLNSRLIEAPRNCIEYVIMHELCHFVHPNHSKQFYMFMTMFMPDWRERKKILENECLSEQVACAKLKP